MLRPWAGSVCSNGGIGAPADEGKARAWYERAAAAGDAVAMHLIGALYENGRSVPKDAARARDWYERAAAAADAAAMREIGVLYETAGGLPQDLSKAGEWYEKAGTAGDAVAMRNLARLYVTLPKQATKKDSPKLDFGQNLSVLSGSERRGTLDRSRRSHERSRA